MNILIIRNASRNDFGGAETYAYNLCQALKSQNHFPILVTSLLPLVEKSKLGGLSVIKGPWKQSQKWSRAYYIRYLLSTLWYCYIIVRHKVDVLNPQGRDDFIFATTAGWIMRKPVIWTDHADLKYILDRENHPNKRIQGWILSAAKKTSVIVCVSESEKKEIERVAPELLNLRVIHNGVFIPKDTHPVKHPSSVNLIVGTNARLVATKGIKELIKGFADSEVQASSELWIIGSENDDKQTFYDFASVLGVSDKVKFIGYVTNPNDYVSAMDIFVHASYHEAFSLAVIEAAMLGKAIIATAVGGTPEILDSSCGILIEPRSAVEISKALNTLGTNVNLRRSIAVAAQLKASSDFNFETIVKNEIIPLYSSAILQ